MSVMCSILLQEACIGTKPREHGPVGLLHEGLPLLPLVRLVRPVLGIRHDARDPIVVKPVAEGPLAIVVQAHQPEDREECSDCPLVLVIHCSAAARGWVYGFRLVAVETQLWERRRDILVELPASVGRISDPRCRDLGSGPVCLLALHEVRDDGATTAILPNIGIRPEGHWRHLPLLVVRLVEGKRRFVPQCGLTRPPSRPHLVRRGPAEAGDDGVWVSNAHGFSPSKGEIGSIRKPNVPPAARAGVHNPYCNFVDRVHRGETRVGPRSGCLLCHLVRDEVYNETLLLLLQSDADTLQQGFFHCLFPTHLSAHSHGDWLSMIVVRVLAALEF
mmetsp:Transcript_20778/g.45750  ORF Transcript_20778/g.45750 Transcript_20778/m.45750 type:complete len:332 (+) Transcript_20778:1472-2467(+)